MMQANAAKKAAQEQAAAARYAADMQYKMYQQQRSDYEPWRQTGIGALSDLANPDFKRDFTMSDFQQDPGYAFRMAEGQKALERSAAARGGLQGGGTLKALAKYGQDFASNEYGNAYNRFNADRDRRFNRLSSLAGLGQTATGQLGQAGQNYANQAGQNLMGAANAMGASRIAQANAWGGAMNNASNLGMQGLWMSKFNQAQAQPGTYSSGGTPTAGQAYPMQFTPA
jgi:hypothetical protein